MTRAIAINPAPTQGGHTNTQRSHFPPVVMHASFESIPKINPTNETRNTQKVCILSRRYRDASPSSLLNSYFFGHPMIPLSHII